MGDDPALDAEVSQLLDVAFLVINLAYDTVVAASPGGEDAVGGARTVGLGRRRGME